MYLRKVHIIGGIDNDVTNEERSKMLCYYEIYIYIWDTCNKSERDTK
jgi:hypothetical protein